MSPGAGTSPFWKPLGKPGDRMDSKKRKQMKLCSSNMLAPVSDLSKEELVARLVSLQTQLIQRDASILALNQTVLVRQQDEHKKQELKRCFSTIEKRHIDTSTVHTVLEDSFHHLNCTIVNTFGGKSAVLLLDVPYNAVVGAKNTDVRQQRILRTYWGDDDSRGMEQGLADLRQHRDVIVQKKPKLWSFGELTAAVEDGGYAGVLTAFLVVPVVIENTTIALVLCLDGEYTQRDGKLLFDLLPEIWTSNVQALINIALEAVRNEKMEDTLAEESRVRDEVILSLERVVDDTLEQIALSVKTKSGKELWTEILTNVANFFEEYFESEVLLAVTNTEANTSCKERAPTRRSSNVSTSRQSISDTGKLGLKFMFYIFSDGTRSIRTSKMKHIPHPQLREGSTMERVLMRGVPMFSSDGSSLTLPSGHMRISSMLLVPIIFLGEPVGLLGLANGRFDNSSGRILQSVFTTFWSMILKATLLSDFQRVLNAALPAQISERVKHGDTIADNYVTATVLYADIVGFTSFTRELASDQVVEYSNLIFSKLDRLVQDAGLEKIKVMGDCYMAAGGVQDKSGRLPPSRGVVVDSQARQMATFALRILKEADEVNRNVGLGTSAAIREGLKKQPLCFRVGVALGPMTAGVFGTEKVQYDVFGPTVNLASRLESGGRPGMVQVSETMYEALAPLGFTFEKRDPFYIKGFGEYQAYFLTGAPSATPQIVAPGD
eukprot:gene17976-27674_t